MNQNEQNQVEQDNLCVSLENKSQIDLEEEIENSDDIQAGKKKRSRNILKLSLQVEIELKNQDQEYKETLSIQIDSNEMLKSLKSIIISQFTNVQMKNELKKNIYMYLKQSEKLVLISAKQNKSLEELGVQDGDHLFVYSQLLDNQNEVQIIEIGQNGDIEIIEIESDFNQNQSNRKIDLQDVQIVQKIIDNEVSQFLKLEIILDQDNKINDQNSDKISFEVQIPLKNDNEKRKIDILKDKEQQTLINLLKYADIFLNNQNIYQQNKIYTCEVINMDSFNPIFSYKISQGDDFNSNIIQIFYPSRYLQGFKQNDQFYCNQQIFRKCTPNGSVKILWVLHNIGGDDKFFNKLDDDHQVHFIESGAFESIDGMMWKLRLIPGYSIKNDQNEYLSESPTFSKIQLISLLSESDNKAGNNVRTIHSEFSIFVQNNNGTNVLWSHKDWKQDMKFEHGDGENLIVNEIEKFYSFEKPYQMRINGMNEQSFIQLEIQHLIQKDDHQSDKQTILLNQESLTSEDEHISNDESSQSVKFKGLMNEGQTCYLNSLFQTLFFIRAFRNAVYKIPTLQRLNINHDQIETSLEIKSIEKLIPFCMQRIFFNLQLGNSQFVRTHELLQAFGWTGNERFQQQDVNEFNCKLSDNLESLMENTEVQGTYAKLFEGKLQNVIKCINIDYESKREEKFLTLQLNVKNNFTIEDSIREYISQEKLEGENQYETQNDGKQDARKFIRFIKLPPVLQISLNRYEYDIQNGNQIKINQKLEFKEVLDLESILPKDDSNSQNFQNKPANRYHLHSILVHRGTANSGHYYAFIKPSINNQWYEFNDDKVKEVTKEYAIGQGVGGNNTEFELKRFSNQNFINSSAQLYEKQYHNLANAYMLIYVREEERESIMTDKQNIDQQIPKELQEHFKLEEHYKSQIDDDFNCATQFGDMYLQSQEILSSNQWDGDLICSKFKQKNQLCLNFEQNHQAHMRLFIDKEISFNEFIVMIKNRFFNNNKDIELEDIWLYRLMQFRKQGNKEQSFHQYMIKQTYSLEDNHDCPLFSNKPQFTCKDWNSFTQGKKWKQLNDSCNKLIVINPLKINPKTGKPYSIIKKMNEQEIKQQTDHYNQFIDFVKKTDMINGSKITPTYNQLMKKNQYQFVDNSVDNLNQQQDQISLQINENHQDHQFNILENQKIYEQSYRRHFIFKLDKKIKKHENKIYAQLQNQKEDLELQSTQNIEQFFQGIPKQLDENSSFRNQFLIVLKKADFDTKQLNYKNIIFMDIRKPIDFRRICENSEIEYESLMLNHYQIIIEPCSHNSLQLNQFSDQESDQKQKKKLIPEEELLEKGISIYKGNNDQILYLNPKVAIQKQHPLIEYINQDIYKQGLTFVFYPIADNRQLLIQMFDFKDNDSDREKFEQKFQQIKSKKKKINLDQHYYELILQQFTILLEVISSRIYINLCLLEYNDILQTSWIQNRLGVHQFNFMDSFQEICTRVADICKTQGIHQDNPNSKMLVNHLKFLDESYSHFCFEDLVNFNEQKNKNQILKYLLTNQLFLNFFILKYPFNQSDTRDEFKFKVYMYDEIYHHKNNNNLGNQKNFNEIYMKFEDKSISDIIQNYKVQNNIDADETFLPMKIDRSSSTIIKIWKQSRDLAKVISNRKNSVLNELNQVFRLQNFSKYEFNQILDYQNKQEVLIFALFYIYDEKSKSKQGDQFIVPCTLETSFDQLYINLKRKLQIIIQNPNNNLNPFDLDSLVMHTMKYKQKFSISKNGRQQFYDEYDYEDPELQHRIILIDHGNFTIGNVLLSSTNKVSYQPYGDQDPHKFVYMAAMVTFLQDEIDGIMEITVNENNQSKKKNIGLNLQNRDSD